MMGGIRGGLVNHGAIKPTRVGFGSAVSLLTICLLTVGSASGAPQAGSAQEQSLFAATNQARAGAGLSPLRWDDSLAQAAKAHAEIVVQNGQLSHQYAGEGDLASRAAQAGARFQTIAENIAMGASVKTIQNEWMKSPPHRANILDSNLNAVGFAVIQRGDSFYAVADFDRSVATLTLDQTEAAIEKLLVPRNLQVSGSSPDARQTCEMEHGSAGNSHPRFVMRWQSSDLSQLPPDLLSELDNRQYRSAVVGACSSANAGSTFSSYRIAVLLY